VGGLAVGLCQVIGGVDYWDWKTGENFAARLPLPLEIDHPVVSLAYFSANPL
jgi:hypothetical protein